MSATSQDFLARLLENHTPKLSVAKKIYSQLDAIEAALSHGYSSNQLATAVGVKQPAFSAGLQQARKKALEKRSNLENIESDQNIRTSNLLNNLRAKLTNNMLDKFSAELDEIEIAIKEGFSKKQIAHELGLNPDLFLPMLIVCRQIEQENLGGEQ